MRQGSLDGIDAEFAAFVQQGAGDGPEAMGLHFFGRIAQSAQGRIHCRFADAPAPVAI